MDFVRETSDDRSPSDKSPDICIRYEGTRGNDKSTLSTWAEQMAIDVHKLHWLVTVQECMCIGRDTRLKTRYKFVEFRRHPSRDRAPTDDEKHALEEYRSLEKKRERKIGEKG